MARTVQEIYDKAVHLVDAQRESDGSTASPDAAGYRVRCCQLLNTLLNEVLPVSDTCPGPAQGRRPVHPPVSRLEDRVEMDDYVCLSLLPVGLAALFLREEDRAGYTSLWGDYLERLDRAARTRPAGETQAVDDPYGGIEFCRFGSWE